MILTYSAAKVIGKTAIWMIVSLWVSPLDHRNWEFMSLMEQPHAQWRLYQNLLYNGHNMVLLEKYVKNKDFV